jgi:ribosomal protein S7
VYNVLNGLLTNLYVPVTLVTGRKGKGVFVAPVPVQRNKRETMAVQTFATAVVRRSERSFTKRVENEIVSQTTDPLHSSTLRARDSLFSAAFENRADEYRRWR